MAILQVGDVGTEVVLDCGFNLSTATVMKIVARTPKGEKKTWNAVLEGTTKIKYTLASGDVDSAGTWQLQAYIEMPGWLGHGLPLSLNVSNNL